MLLIQRNYSAQLVKPPSLSLWSGHQRAISERELWRGVVNAHAVHHRRKRPFREMKELRTNRGPDVTCLRLIEFLSTYAQENRTRHCYWGVFTPNTHTHEQAIRLIHTPSIHSGLRLTQRLSSHFSELYLFIRYASILVNSSWCWVLVRQRAGLLVIKRRDTE